MASKDPSSTDSPSNAMELPSAVIAQAEAAASNEIAEDFRHDPDTQSERISEDMLIPGYVQRRPNIDGGIKTE